MSSNKKRDGIFSFTSLPSKDELELDNKNFRTSGKVYYIIENEKVIKLGKYIGEIGCDHDNLICQIKFDKKTVDYTINLYIEKNSSVNLPSVNLPSVNLPSVTDLVQDKNYGTSGKDYYIIENGEVIKLGKFENDSNCGMQGKNQTVGEQDKIPVCYLNFEKQTKVPIETQLYIENKPQPNIIPKSMFTGDMMKVSYAVNELYKNLRADNLPKETEYYEYIDNKFTNLGKRKSTTYEMVRIPNDDNRYSRPVSVDVYVYEKGKTKKKKKDLYVKKSYIDNLLNLGKNNVSKFNKSDMIQISDTIMNQLKDKKVIIDRLPDNTEYYDCEGDKCTKLGKYVDTVNKGSEYNNIFTNDQRRKRKNELYIQKSYFDKLISNAETNQKKNQGESVEDYMKRMNFIHVDNPNFNDEESKKKDYYIFDNSTNQYEKLGKFNKYYDEVAPHPEDTKEYTFFGSWPHTYKEGKVHDDLYIKNQPTIGGKKSRKQTRKSKKARKQTRKRHTTRR